MLLLLLALFACPGRGTAAVLDGSTDALPLWPHVELLRDPELRHEAGALLADPGAFAAPTTAAYGTLGIVRGAVWLRMPLAVRSQGSGEWILDFDHAALGRIDVYVTAGGVLLEHAVLGNRVPFAERPMPGRSHAMRLDLPPRDDYLLLVRVESDGAMILPATLERLPAFHLRALHEQMLQGLLNGIGLCLLLYSLGQWIALREPLFGKYALLISGSLMFSLLFFGIGGLYLWRDNRWMDLHVATLAALLAPCGAFLFIEQSLAEPGTNARFSQWMKAASVLTLAIAVLYAADLIDTKIASYCVSVLGPLPSLMGIPLALRRARRGDAVGFYFLLAWAIYFITTGLMVAIVNGHAPTTFWNIHAFQFGATLDMLLFMRVLGLRTVALQSQARQLHALAHTDALTGLLNRRGLEAPLSAALKKARPGWTVAVYLLDLDGFKPVNDRHGHAIGDKLLAAVALRLRSILRAGQDHIARLGGDEFVVVATGLYGPQQAIDLGDKLLSCFQAPFQLGDFDPALGATIGYALAPMDGQKASDLLERADEAMYRGKQQGKNAVHRAAPQAADRAA